MTACDVLILTHRSVPRWLCHHGCDWLPQQGPARVHCAEHRGLAAPPPGLQLHDPERLHAPFGDRALSSAQFTAEVLDQEIKSFEHATFVYRFKPHENFDLRDFGFQLNVNYIDNNEAPFRHTPFNATVQCVCCYL